MIAILIILIFLACPVSALQYYGDPNPTYPYSLNVTGTVTATTFSGNSINGLVPVASSAAPTIDANGKFSFDTTEDQLQYYGTAKRVLSYKQTKTFVITDPAASSDFYIWRPQQDITVTDVKCLTVAGTVTVDIKECNTNGASCATILSSTVNCATTDTAASISDGAITAANRVQAALTTVTGTVTQLSTDLYYTINSK